MSGGPTPYDALVAERDDLRRWKDEALTVLVDWHKVHVAAGAPGKLGESIALATRDEVIRLHNELAECREQLLAESGRHASTRQALAYTNQTADVYIKQLEGELAACRDRSPCERSHDD